MLGGGQLGRFFVSAAHEMGYKVWVLDPDPHSPAGLVADRHLVAAYDDYVALDSLGNECAAVTTEFENVPADTLDYLTKFIPVHPAASAVAVCQNRIAEKTFLADNGLPHGPFAVVRSEDDVRAANAGLFPAIPQGRPLRLRRQGPGPRRRPRRALAAFQHFRGEPCVLEKMLALDCEVSVVLARRGGQMRRSLPDRREPPPQRHPRRDHRAGASACPSEGTQLSAQEIAERIADKLGYVGTLGWSSSSAAGELVVNEMAPRPHNSGHHTIDACDASQYEQQVRGLCACRW